MKKQLIMAMLVLSTVVACKKDKDKEESATPAPSKATQAKAILVGANWYLDSTLIGAMTGPMFPVPKEPCEEDNSYIFYDDNKQVLDFGKEKCDTSEPAYDEMYYGFSANADSLILSDGVERISMYIQSLQAKRAEFTMSGSGYRQKIVLKRK